MRDSRSGSRPQFESAGVAGAMPGAEVRAVDLMAIDANRAARRRWPWWARTELGGVLQAQAIGGSGLQMIFARFLEAEAGTRQVGRRVAARRAEAAPKFFGHAGARRIP